MNTDRTADDTPRKRPLGPLPVSFVSFVFQLITLLSFFVSFVSFVFQSPYTPCFRLAEMKSSRSPSSTACVLPTS
jgi:hypothetical protein